MDRIIVRTNAAMQKIMDWVRGMGEPELRVPFSEGEIEFVEELELVKFRKEDGDTIWFELWIHSSADTEFAKLVSWRVRTDAWEFLDVKIEGTGLQKAELGMMLAQHEVLPKTVAKFWGLMLYSVYYREEVERTKVVERRSAGRKSRGKRSNRRMLTVRKYTVSEELLSELPVDQPKRKYEKHTESFGVRGHYRTYRSGKTVWVRPYTKGNAEKRSDKEYVV